jgi:hypothetical protein
MTSTDVVVRRDGMAAKVQYAKELANSGLLPTAYRKNPANVLYAVEYGEMLGLAPMAAITGIHIIEGKPTASSALMSALVRKAGHRLRITGNDERAVVEITRCDDPDYTFRAEWTIARAKQAGLTGKDVWKKYPAALLKARGITECARDACEEALMGMHYTPEELGATVDEDGIPVQVQAERVQTPQDDTDWDAAIELAGTDVEALKALYKKAAGIYGNSNPGLAERLVAAGKAAAAAAAAPGEVLDAEVVDESAGQSTGPVAAQDTPATEAGTPATDKLLTQIQNLAEAMTIAPEDVERHFEAKHGKTISAGTEAELMTFRAELQKNGLTTPASSVRAAA